MKKTFITVSSVMLVLLVFAHPALAYDTEYYTYGGFNLMVPTFNGIALIFNAVGYKGLLFVFAIFGMIGGAIAWLLNCVAGHKSPPLLWAAQVIFGVVLYMALFVPTGKMAIYDPVLNKTQTIGGIPDAVTFTAGTLNLVQRAIVKVADMLSPPDGSYALNGTGMGFNLLQDMNSAQDVYAQMSLERYIKDCVTFELERPGGTITYQELVGPNTNYLATFAKAVNPAIYTVYYDATDNNGLAMTCTDAWARLSAFYNNPSNYDTALKNTCSALSIDSSDSSEMTSCKNLISNTLAYTTGTTYSYDTILRQKQFAQMLYQVYMANPVTSVALQADRNITSTGLGIGITMNEWIPIIMTVITAIAICMIPFMTLLLPTPMVGKVLQTMFGLFVFLTVWAIIDAIIHIMIVYYAMNQFTGVIGPDNLGLLAMTNLPTLSSKILAVLGIARGAGMMLSGFVTFMIIGFGGSLLAHLVGSLSGAAIQSGAAGGKELTPEGRSAEQQQLLEDWANMTVEQQERFSNRGRGLALMREQHVESANNTFAEAEALGLSTDINPVAKSMAGNVPALTTNMGTVNAVRSPGGKVWSSLGSPTGGNYGFDPSGKAVRAKIPGLNPIQVAETATQQKVTAASHALGNSTSFRRALSEGISVGGSDATSRAEQNQFSKMLATNFERNIGQGSDFARHVNKEDYQSLKTFIGASTNGLPFISIGAQGYLQATGEDGRNHTLKVSENTANALRNAQQKAWQETLSSTASSTEGANWLRQAAEDTGNTNAYNLLNEARDISQSQEAFGEDLTAAFLSDYALRHYGDSSMQNVVRAGDSIAEKIAHGGPEGARSVDSDVYDFLREYKMPGTNANRQEIHNFGGKASAGAPSDVTAAADRAAAITGGVHPADFQGRNLTTPSDKATGISDKIRENDAHILQTGRERSRSNEDAYKNEKSIVGDARELLGSHHHAPNSGLHIDNVDSVVKETEGVKPEPKPEEIFPKTINLTPRKKE